MKPLKLLPLLLLLVLTASAPAGSLGDAANVTPPAGWNLVENDRPSPFPTLKYVSPAGHKAVALISLLPASQATATDLVGLKRFHARICTPFLPSPDFAVESRDLKPVHGIGVYATFEDPSLVGKTPAPGEYKNATSACLFLGGDVLVQATILCDDPTAPEFREALDMLRGIAASGGKTSGRPPAPRLPAATSPTGPLRVVPPAGFTESPLKENPHPGYFAYVNAQGVMLTGWLDQASKFKGMRSFWATEKAGLEKSAGIPIRNETLKIVGSWNVVSYEVPLEPGVMQKNLRACKTAGGTWADLHLSCPPGSSLTTADLEAVLTQIKLVPIGEK